MSNTNRSLKLARLARASIAGWVLSSALALAAGRAEAQIACTTSNLPVPLVTGAVATAGGMTNDLNCAAAWGLATTNINIGIGTTSPSTLLQVGSGSTTGKLSIDSQDNSYGQIQIGNPASTAEASMVFISGVTAFGDAPTSTNGSAYIWGIGAGPYGIGGNKFAIDNSNYGGPILTILSTGLVGIGTTAPTSTLQVAGTITATGESVNGAIASYANPGGDGYLAYGRSSDSFVWAPLAIQNNASTFEGGLAWGSAGLNIDVGSSLTDAITVLNSGYVGIGMATPTAPLDVNGNGHFVSPGSGSTGGVVIRDNPSNNGDILQFVNNAITAQYGYIQGLSGTGIALMGGDVGIGTTSPTYLLYVNGTAYATGAAGALSDIRHKDKVATLPDGALSLVERLRPVSFVWKTPTDDGMKGEQIGFIAQEVEKIIPSVVLTEANAEKTKDLKYTEIIPVLTKAIQEQEAEIAELRAEVAALKSKITPAPAH